MGEHIGLECWWALPMAWVWILWWVKYKDEPWDCDHVAYLWPALRSGWPYRGHVDVKMPGIHFLWLALARMGIEISPQVWRWVYALHMGVAFLWAGPQALVLMLPHMGAVLANTEGFALPWAIAAIHVGSEPVRGFMLGVAATYAPHVALAGLIMRPGWETLTWMAVWPGVLMGALVLGGTWKEFLGCMMHWVKPGRRRWRLNQLTHVGRIRSLGAALVLALVLATSRGGNPWAVTVAALPVFTGLVFPYHFIAPIVFASLGSLDISIVALGIFLILVCVPEARMWSHPIGAVLGRDVEDKFKWSMRQMGRRFRRPVVSKYPVNMALVLAHGPRFVCYWPEVPPRGYTIEAAKALGPCVEVAGYQTREVG